MRALAIVLLALSVACGGGGTRLRSSGGASGAIDPAAFLVEVGATRTDMLRADTRSIEELESARDAAQGAERRRALIALARAHMLEAGTSDDRAQRRHRSSAERFAEAAANGSRDAELLAQSDFVPLWLAYRAGDRSAAGRAERFTTRRAQSGELALLGWVVRGEIAFAAEEWDAAAAAYRYVLGQLGHPLYAYSLYRTAQSHEGAGRAEDARTTLAEVALLGCPAEADEPTRRVALQAARDLGTEVRRGADGVERPASCPEPSSGGESTESGEWRPAE